MGTSATVSLMTTGPVTVSPLATTVKPQPLAQATGLASASISSAGADGGQGKAQEKEVGRVRLADLAKCEVCVCFEGPLGAHLKTEVREKIWKGEYVEFFFPAPAREV